MKTLGEDGHLQAEGTGMGLILFAPPSDRTCPVDILVLDFVLPATDLHWSVFLDMVFGYPFIPHPCMLSRQFRT